MSFRKLHFSPKLEFLETCGLLRWKEEIILQKCRSCSEFFILTVKPGKFVEKCLSGIAFLKRK